MALKASIDSLDGVPEALHEHYTQSEDGKYRLNAEGIEDVSGLKSALAKEREERKRAKEALDKLKDVDPEEYQTLKKEATERKEKKLLDSGKVEELIVERTSRMKADYDKQLKDLSTERDALQQKLTQLDQLTVDNAMSAAAAKAGVLPEALPYVLRHGREVFRVKDGQIVALKDDQPVIGKDGTSPMSMEEWLGELASSSAFLFKASSGGGAAHKPAGSGGAPARKRSDMSPQEKAKFIGEHGTDKYLALPA
jgi:hypothetical protein